MDLAEALSVAKQYEHQFRSARKLAEFLDFVRECEGAKYNLGALQTEIEAVRVELEAAGERTEKAVALAGDNERHLKYRKEQIREELAQTTSDSNKEFKDHAESSRKEEVKRAEKVEAEIAARQEYAQKLALLSVAKQYEHQFRSARKLAEFLDFVRECEGAKYNLGALQTEIEAVRVELEAAGERTEKAVALAGDNERHLKYRKEQIREELAQTTSDSNKEFKDHAESSRKEEVKRAEKVEAEIAARQEYAQKLAQEIEALIEKRDGIRTQIEEFAAQLQLTPAE